MSEKRTAMVIGDGAREHASVEAFQHSEHLDQVVAVPGNDLMAEGELAEDTPVIFERGCDPTDPSTIVPIAEKHRPDVVLIDSEEPLKAGLADALRAEGIPVSGPDRAAARIEWDKDWAYELLHTHGVRTPVSRTFVAEQIEAARSFVDDLYQQDPSRTLYLKDNDLAAGKGVFPVHSRDEAFEILETLKERQKFQIQEETKGEELSRYTVTDGFSFRHLDKSAQDHKPAYDNDEGPMTGSMGTFAPTLVDNVAVKSYGEYTMTRINGALAEAGIVYQGTLYGGAIIDSTVEPPYTIDNHPFTILEVNARWGDPEAVVLVPGLRADFYDLHRAIANRDVMNLELPEDRLTRVGVVLASRNYPNDASASVGKQIRGLRKARSLEGVDIYGYKVTAEDGKYYVAAPGGRVLIVVGTDADPFKAHEKAYEAVEYVSAEDDQLRHRTDIGRRDLERLRRGLKPALAGR